MKDKSEEHSTVLTNYTQSGIAFRNHITSAPTRAADGSLVSFLVKTTRAELLPDNPDGAVSMSADPIPVPGLFGFDYLVPDYVSTPPAPTGHIMPLHDVLEMQFDAIEWREDSSSSSKSPSTIRPTLRPAPRPNLASGDPTLRLLFDDVASRECPHSGATGPPKLRGPGARPPPPRCVSSGERGGEQPSIFDLEELQDLLDDGDDLLTMEAGPKKEAGSNSYDTCMATFDVEMAAYDARK